MTPGSKGESSHRMRFLISGSLAVWVVAGEVAVGLAADRSSETILSIPGAEQWRAVLDDLIEHLREGGRVVIALSPFWRQTPSIEAATWDLARVCHALSFHVEVASWDPQYRSLGEAWGAGITPQLQALPSLSPPEWHYRQKSRVLASLPSLETQAPMGLMELRARLEEGLREAFR
jgi:hypothetical protein